jgi:CRISPR-associated protein Csm5
MKVKIQTLAPVHVGSGKEFQPKFEYLYFKDERLVALIDDVKVLEILRKENIGQWIACIEKRESLLDLLKTYRPNLCAADVAQRTFPLSKGTEKAIREQMHTLNDKALLPGTSVKGAIRTVLFAHLMSQKVETADSTVKRRNRNTNIATDFFDKPALEQFFGKDPNHDIFRLLHIGDTNFDSTICETVNVINLMRNGWEIDSKLTQIVETLPNGSTSELAWSFNHETLKQANKREGANYFSPNAELLKMPNLFKLINAHTQRLIDSEIKYWANEKFIPHALGNYLEDLANIRKHTEESEKSCVLRLGWGSGFRSMTGDWHDAMTNDDYHDLVKHLRDKPKKGKFYDEGLIFPKTLRLLESGQPLGFVKLSV